MQNFRGASLRTRLAVLTLLFTGFFTGVSFAYSTHNLVSGEWSLITIPADPGDSTIEQLFADDLPSDSYGKVGGWVMYSFDTATNSNTALAVTNTLEANTAYWILQRGENTVELDIPASLAPLVGEDTPGCPSGKRCVVQNLAGSERGIQWNLVGVSIDRPFQLTGARFQLNNELCTPACTSDQAIGANLIGPNVYRYAGKAFERLDESAVLQPWDSVVMGVLGNTSSLKLLLPIDNVPDVVVPPVTSETDAARLLMQASFGPTDASIQEVLDLGGPAQWIDAQVLLPAQRHLPIVSQLLPNETGVQASRYEAFWQRTVRAEDQLRQRVAFALSQFLVISDKSTAIASHGDLAAAYYDVLIDNAFGNYRDLLQGITLSPAMGLYLSMLGNDKPDNATGLRADENYAREVMQLFTIGLVGLNIDGTERKGVDTYTQPDVENMARALTGWFWNVDAWSTNTFEGWQPGRETLVEPMKAFSEHHDTDEKTVLGETLPAGQSAEDDLQQVLDILFNHPNVAPFVSSQLIKRLVTSNPSGDYVKRVSMVFNNNGAGVRGDMAAVVRAILLDEEARGATSIERDDFGKLREPLLRYAHLWRAFRVTDPIGFKKFVEVEIPQIAPLTAPSVFNYYSPKFAPPGEISKANLVAPEFQINSGSSLNVVNRTLMSVVQNDNFKGVQTTLNLERERQLLDNPSALLDHLSRLLTAGRLTDVSKQKLTRYMSVNSGLISDERLLRDVIGLVVTSTEYAVQR